MIDGMGHSMIYISGYVLHNWLCKSIICLNLETHPSLTLVWLEMLNLGNDLHQLFPHEHWPSPIRINNPNLTKGGHILRILTLAASSQAHPLNAKNKLTYPKLIKETNHQVTNNAIFIKTFILKDEFYPAGRKTAQKSPKAPLLIGFDAKFTGTCMNISIILTCICHSLSCVA